MAKTLNYSLKKCAHYVFTAFPYEDLGHRGFHLDPELDRDENGMVIQTLLVNVPQGSASVALEFREIVDEEEFLASSKKTMAARRGREILRPYLEFYGDHATSVLLGGIPVEVSSESLVHRVSAEHSNSVESLWGVYLGLADSGIREWSDFLGAPPENGEWILRDGVRLIIAQPGDGLYEFMELRKDFSLWAVVLQSRSFLEFEKQAMPERVFQWRGHSAALIKEHLTDWDLLVI